MYEYYMHYFIKTFGCQMNTSDSERIATFLEAQGFLPSEEIQKADLVIFNTCGVKQTAENRAYSMINNLRKAEKASVLKAKSYLPAGQAGQLKAIVMTGCLANRVDVQKRMRGKVDLFTEIKNFPEAVSSILYDVFCMNAKIQNTNYQIQNTKNILSKENISYLSINPKYANNFEAYVPIMTGCNNFCAYCVVPNARGREVSRPAEEILSEVKNLIAKGYKNIILLGQNVNSYRGTESNKQETKNKNQSNTGHESLSLRGCIHPKQSRTLLHSFSTPPRADRDDDKTIDFATLLEKINAIEGEFWIQFVSSHPKDMNDELIQTIAKCQKVCETVHLPLQAGDDEILQKMNRKYTQKHYLELIEKIKKAFQKYKPAQLFSISSDIIVGFPGETKKQFLQSAQVMKKAKFDMVFFGQFSPRPQTVAWTMKDDVSQIEKARREKFLNEILKKTALENNQAYLGQTVEVLIEQEKNNVYFGKTRTLKNVKIISAKKDLLGKIVKVKITKANVWNLEGEV